MAARNPVQLLKEAALATCVALAALAISAASAHAGVKHTAAVSVEKVDEKAYQQLIDATNAVVGISVKALPNARSNETLGAQRDGSGIVINDHGLILTIGYLILEADSVEVVDSEGQKIPAVVLSYDHASDSGWCARSRPSRRSRSAWGPRAPCRSSTA
jgi:S1-C subfamily serine protease